jgi:uncharacterized protein involved in outer membrane biogenesis
MPAVRGRRYLVILAVLAGLVGLYTAVGFLLVPRWTRSELTQLTARDFGRTLSIGDVSFNPFTWTLRITDFSFPDADGRPMISFGRLQVAVGISSVPRLAPSLSGIVLDSPHVNAVVRRDGRLNLADLEKPFEQPGTRPTRSKPSKLFVDRLAVANGSATYEDDSRSAPFRLDLNPIGFELLNFSTAGSTAGSYQLTATIAQGGRLNWAGTVRSAPLSLHGTLELDGLSAPMVGRYLGAILPAEISRGTASLQGSFAIDSEPQGSVRQRAAKQGSMTQASGAQGLSVTVDVPRAQVSGLGVRPRRASADYVQLNRFTLDNTHIDLGQHSIRVGLIALSGADIRGWLDRGGELNLLELLGRSAGPPTTARGAPRKTAAPTWRIAAPDVRIEDSRVSLQDRGVKPAADLILAPLSARITGYDGSPGSRIRVSLESAVNRKGRLRLNADGTLQPEALSAKLDLSRIDLRAVQPYLNKYSAITLTSGVLGTALDLEWRADGGLSAAGRIGITNLRTVDDDLKQDFVKWQDLHIVGFRYASHPASLHIERIVAVAPYARIIIGADRTMNVSEALHPRGYHPPAATSKSAHAGRSQAKSQEAAAQGTAAQAGGQPAAQSPSAKASMPMTIGLVRIANGTTDYADLSMQPNFATGIQDLHGTIKGLSSDPKSRATVNLQGSVNDHAPVDISGVVNLLSASTYTDIRMKFRGLELTQMTPYAVRFAGYEIASGTLDADLHYKVDHSRLDADHTLVIDQLQLGEQVPSPHAVKLPLKLAIALLKDRNGVIRLGLPITGSLDNPQFSLGPLLGKALLAVLKKAVTAPFAMLGRLFGGGPDMNRIDFAPGSAALLPAARARLAAVAKALAQRPQLQLEVPAVFAPDVDRPALAQRELRRELLALVRGGALNGAGHGSAARGRQTAPQAPVGREVLELPAAHYRLLRAAYQRAFGPKAALPAAAHKVPPFEPAILEMQSALLKRMQISDADLQALAGRRAQAIRSAILSAGGVDAGRVAVTAATPQASSEGKVAVKLGLK